MQPLVLLVGSSSPFSSVSPPTQLLIPPPDSSNSPAPSIAPPPGQNAPPPDQQQPEGSPPVSVALPPVMAASPPASSSTPSPPVANAPPPPAPLANAPPPSTSSSSPSSPPSASTSPPPAPSTAAPPPSPSPPPPPSIAPENSPPLPSSSPPPPIFSPPPVLSSPPSGSVTPPPTVSPPSGSVTPPTVSPPSGSVIPPTVSPPSVTPPTVSPSPPTVPPSNPSPPAVPSPSPPVLHPPPPIIVTSLPPVIVYTPPPIQTLPPPPNQSTNTSDVNSGGLGTAGAVALSVACSVLFLGIFGTVAFCAWNRRKKDNGANGHHIMPTTLSYRASGPDILKLPVSASNDGSGSSNNVTPRDPGGGLRDSRLWFTYEELIKATDGFSAHNLLGEGGFGSVYKGTLVDGREVAVKKLKIVGGDGDREFRSEVVIISRIHHRHLVSLVGYCIYEERRLLVYDYLPNATLYFHLHGKGRPVLDWSKRIRIAVGAARGIAYLHEDCHPRIIHRDIKSSNILLDNNFEARVSDFGLAKLAMDVDSHITTRVMGTFGYMAPEYASSGKLTEKSDVYSFGVVLLELISGRKSVDNSQPLGEESLVEWARPLLNHALEAEEFGELPDPKLEGNYVTDEMFRLIEAAAACVRHSSAKRPTMGQIVRAFDSMATSDLTNGMKVGESEVFNSALQSAQIRFFRRLAFGSPEFSTEFFSQNSRTSFGNTEIIAEGSENSVAKSENSAERLETGEERIRGPSS